MNFKRVKLNIFLSNQIRLIISICEIMSTDQGKWFHFLVCLSRVFLVVVGVFFFFFCSVCVGQLVTQHAEGD